MNTKNNVVVVLLSALIIILIVIILKKNNREKFMDKLTVDRYSNLRASKRRTGSFPSSMGLSWVSSTVTDDPVLFKTYNYMYKRDCPPPLISQMGKYDYYLPLGNQSMPKE